MKKILKLLNKTMGAFAVAGFFTSAALALPGQQMNVHGLSPAVTLVSGDCRDIGMQQAEQMGGQLARASAETQGGQQVCVIVILLPAKDGQRPRRSEIVVPLG